MKESKNNMLPYYQYLLRWYWVFMGLQLIWIISILVLIIADVIEENNLIGLTMLFGTVIFIIFWIIAELKKELSFLFYFGLSCVVILIGIPILFGFLITSSGITRIVILLLWGLFELLSIWMLWVFFKRKESIS